MSHRPISRKTMIGATAASLAAATLPISTLTAAADAGLLSIRIHVIFCSDDDGSHNIEVDPGGASSYPGPPCDPTQPTLPLQNYINSEGVSNLVQGANKVWGVANPSLFLFDPSSDVTRIRSTLMNHDSAAIVHGADRSYTETQNIVYVGDDNHVYRVSASAPNGPTPTAWTPSDLTAAASAPDVGAAGQISAYVTANGGAEHILFLGSDMHIHAIQNREDGSWYHSDLTVAAQAPSAAGAPFGFSTIDAALQSLYEQAVVYRGADNHIHLLTFGIHWQHTDLTTTLGLPAAAGDPQGFVQYNSISQRLDIPYLVFQANDTAIHVLRRVQGAWQHQSASVLANAPVASGTPHVYTTEYTNVVHIVYRGLDFAIHELVDKGGWTHSPIGSLANAPAASGDPFGITFDDYNPGVDQPLERVEQVPRVVYLTSDGSISLLQYGLNNVDQWGYLNLTQSTNTPPSATNPVAYPDAVRTNTKIVFIDNTGALQQIYSTGAPPWQAGPKWLNTPVSEVSNSKNGKPFSPVGYVSGAGADQGGRVERNQAAMRYPNKLVIIFRYGGGGWSNSVDRFVIMPSVWNPTDFTFLAHEIGHYFHLGHTFLGGTVSADPNHITPTNVNQGAAALVATYVEQLATANGSPVPTMLPIDLIERGLEALDADYPEISDTPPQFVDGDCMYADICAKPVAPYSLKVSFATGQNHTYSWIPDLDNVMNYTPKCRGGQAHLSAQQLRSAIDTIYYGNRSRLLSPALGYRPNVRYRWAERNGS